MTPTQGRMAMHIRRREFTAVLGGLAACGARAAGGAAADRFFNPGTAETATRDVGAFRKGLNESGYIEGHNVAVEYHWLEGHYYDNLSCFQVFLNVLARKFARQHILLVLDGAPNHRCGDLVIPANITLLYLPPYSP